MSDHGLNDARNEALRLLEAGGSESHLRYAAFRLGKALQNAAGDGDLWMGLDQRSRSAEPLSELQLLELRGAVSVNWPHLLDGLGYEPPPPSEVYGEELVRGIRRVLAEGSPLDVWAVQKKVTMLAERLISLSGHEAASSSRLRRWLRRGVRVAGKLAVVVAVAAGGVALAPVLIHVLPHALIAAPAGLAATIDVLKDGTVAVLDWTLDMALPSEGGRGGIAGEYAADQGVLGLLYEVSSDGFYNVRGKWETAEGAGIPDGLVEETTNFVDVAVEALYAAWDTSVGASWFNAALSRGFTDARKTLQQLREMLQDELPPNIALGMLEKIREQLQWAAELLAHDIEPP